MNRRVNQERPFFLLVAAIVCCAIVGSGLLVMHIVTVDDQTQLDTALAAARTYSDSISAFRRFYIREVAPSELELKMLSDESPHTRLARLTEPYSQALNLAETSLSEVGKGRYRVFSHYPWSIRQPLPELSAIEQQVLSSIVADELTEVVEIEESGNGRRLYLGTPIHMEEYCVTCHNNHPQSPAKHWKVGDVRGVQTVEVLLPNRAGAFGLASLGSFPTLWGGFAALVLVTGGVAILLGNRTLRQIRESSAESILDSLGEAVLSIDDSGNVLAMNSAAESLFGYDAGAALGIPLERLVDQPNGLIDTSDRSARESKGIRRDGTTFDCSVLTRPDRSGPADRRVLSLRDISLEKRTREKLAESTQISSIGRLAAGVAHEFNNLLAVILANAEMAKNKVGGEQPEIVEQLDEVLGAGEKGASLVNSLVTNASQRPQWPKRFLAPWFFATLEPTIGAALRDNTRLDAVIDEHTAFFADPDHIEAAVVALITRIDALPDSTDSIEIRMQTVEDRLSEIRVSGAHGEHGAASGADVAVNPENGEDIDLEFAAIRNLIQHSGGELRITAGPDTLLSASIYIPNK